LDVGCGIGQTDSFLQGTFAGLHGVDVTPNMIQAARRRNPGVVYAVSDGKQLPYDAGVFDVAFAINVMHHVSPAAWPSFLSEMRRVVCPGGLCVIFEHNPFNPLTRLVVARCEFDRDAVLLRAGQLKALFRSSGLQTVERNYFLFLPFSWSWVSRLEKGLGWLPLGAQHYLVGKNPPANRFIDSPILS
jgi:SAM-dependent methyltransferase